MFDSVARRVVFREEFLRERDLYAGSSQSLTSQALEKESLNEAKVSLKEAVEVFLEECERPMGTMKEVLQEAASSWKGSP